jgi:hypothetical protein
MKPLKVHGVKESKLTPLCIVQQSLAKHDRYNCLQLLEKTYDIVILGIVGTVLYTQNGSSSSSAAKSLYFVIICSSSLIIFTLIHHCLFKEYLSLSRHHHKEGISQASIINVEKILMLCSWCNAKLCYSLIITILQSPTLLLFYSLDNLKNLMWIS